MVPSMDSGSRSTVTSKRKKEIAKSVRPIKKPNPPRRAKKIDADWWKNAVVYQIYPRSFKDTNGDGIGDLEGIIQKLDYLNDGTPNSLGIDAIWLSPIYPSPMYDFGYDISDYESIDPVFGNLETFKRLLKEAHKRKIRIIMDLVANHTSHQHPWFLESKSSKDNPKRDWYIWRDPVNGKPPNNWMGTFGGRAWTLDKTTDQYYYHSFLAEQPDLNWRNPEVKKAIFSMVKNWLDLGVDGFRLDVVNLFVKDSELRSNPRKRWIARPFDQQNHIYDRDRPEMHDILKDLRKLLDSYGDRMSVGEVMMEPPGTSSLPASYYGAKGDELHLAFNFAFFYTPWKAEKFRDVIKEWEKYLRDKGWPNYTLSNHDFRRHITRYSKGRETTARAKIAALMLLTLRGTPFLYYGEELGMMDERVPKNRIQDPVGIRYWPVYPSRDNCRLPMCWSGDVNGGFSNGEPWLPVFSKYESVNVETQSRSIESLLNFYKKLIWLRKGNDILKKGTLALDYDSPPGVLQYTREFEKKKCLIILNFENESKKIVANANRTAQILISTHRKPEKMEIPVVFEIAPYEGLVLEY